MMALTEQLIAGAAAAVCGGSSVEYQGVQIDLSPPWQRATMAELEPAVNRLYGNRLPPLCQAMHKNDRRAFAGLLAVRTLDPNRCAGRILS